MDAVPGRQLAAPFRQGRFAARRADQGDAARRLHSGRPRLAAGLPVRNPALFRAGVGGPAGKRGERDSWASPGAASRAPGIAVHAPVAEQAAGAPAVEIDELHKSFGSLLVLKGVNLTARAGEVVSMIGSSGSGKSTFLRCINLLEQPDGGRIVIDGEAIRMKQLANGRSAPADMAQVERIRARVGMVFQNFNLWPHMTVVENIIEAPRHVLKEPRDQAVEHAHALLREGRPFRQARPLSGPAVGRPAATRRDRPDARHASPRSSCSTSPHRRSIPSWSARCCGSSASWPRKAIR